VHDEDDAYAQIAVFYEAEYGHLEADVAYYARHGGPGALLVLGCGTGRVCRGLGATRAVAGLDRSAPMLALARQLAPRARYALGDMRDFDLGPCDEIAIPNAAFNFLPSRADQHRCLSCCQRALPAGGLLTIDMPMPDFSLLGTPHTPERLGWTGALSGRAVRRTREVQRFPAAQRLELVDRYYLDQELVATAVLRLRLVFPAEVEWMLEAAGFYVEALHGDYAGNPLGGRSPRLLVRAVRL
jgi:SAM-dependent methyltransferase